MSTRKIYGPPGTGKTTRLINYVKTLIRFGTPIDKIGYFAFTTKAAEESIDRMLKAFPKYSQKDLKYFRTLHSLAFTLLGMKKSNVMQDEHYEDIGRKLGIEVNIFSNGEDKTGFVDSDSEYFNIINAARIKENTVEEEYNTDLYSQDIDKHQLKILNDEVNNYKKAYDLVDFTDMIERFNVSKLCPKYDVVFIDEAQDLSPIQWRMYDILKKNSKHIILAGDDDQAIYGWAGADVKRFQDEPAKDIILPQSYRVPGAVQAIANNILNRIPDHRRVKKNWKPREDVLLPIVEYISSVEDAPLHLGDWLILARTNYRLKNLVPQLRERGLYFEIKNRKSYKARLYRSVQDYSRWTNGDLLSLSECKDLFEFLELDKELKDERMYDLKEFGFSFTDLWYEVFKADPEECLYIREMLRHDEKLSKDPRIKLSTIHAAKGGEANNVLIILDNTKKIREAIEKDQDKYDEEQRVWYVGVTRTKQNLYIMAAKKEDKGYDI